MTDLYDQYAKFNLINRIVLPAMTLCKSNKDGTPSETMKNHYINVAKNGAGLIIVESSAINGNAALGYNNGSQFFSSEHAHAWKPIIDEIHSYDCKVIIQLYHAGRLTVKEIAKTNPLCSSSIPCDNFPSYWRPKINNKIVNFQTNTQYEEPQELTEKEIVNIMNEFGNACELSKKAGFDGVEIHGAHGYLVHCFCRGHVNKRKDKYQVKNYFFLEELINICRNSLSNNLLSFRVSQHTVDNPYLRYNDGDLNLVSLIKKLNFLDIDILHVSEIKAGAKLFGNNRSLLNIAIQYFENTIISCGRHDSVKSANKFLNLNTDLIAFGRYYLANPDLPKILKDKKHNLKKFEYNQIFL